MISFYQKKLQELHTIPNPTMLMKRIITTMNTPNECVYIYEATPTYASLFLSNETGTIYFYPSLQCSLLPPPFIINKKQKNKEENNISLDPIWLSKIVNMDYEARYQSDQDILVFKNQYYAYNEKLIKKRNEEKEESIQLVDIQEKKEKEESVQLVDIQEKKEIYVLIKDDIKSETSSGIKHKKPIPLHLRPKWKR